MSASSQTPPSAPDSLSYELQEVEISRAPSRGVRISGMGNLQFDTSTLSEGIQYWGQPDVTALLKNFSGITTAGDLGAGLIIDGAEASQVLYRIGRVPVIYPYRFGGIFSTFNTTHFSRAEFRRNIHNASVGGRLGARLDFEPMRTLPDRFGGEISPGLISSTCTLRIPAGKKFGLTASGRVSYFDLILGKIIRSSSTDILYNFQDFNLTAIYTPDDANTISLEGFVSHDALGYKDAHYALDTRLKWENRLLALSWDKSSGPGMRNRVFYSGFDCNLGMSMPQFGIKAPSRLHIIGMAGESHTLPVSRHTDLSCGYEAQLYRNTPQMPNVHGYGLTSPQSADKLRAGDARLWVSSVLHISPDISLEPGLSATVYSTHRYHRLLPAPRLTLLLQKDLFSAALHGGRYTQALHQLGFSETGLASDFWLLSSSTLPIQDAWGLSADFNAATTDKSLTLDVNIYWRRVFHQSEFTGQLLDIIDEGYSVYDHINIGSGHNLGVNLTAGYESPGWTLTISAGYGSARRRYRGSSEYHRGRTDPGASFSAQVGWHPTSLPKWNFAAVFKLNSGRPYTPAKSMYLIAGNIITEYGEPNSARLPLYHRLDLSATWQLSKQQRRHPGQSLNFSIINALGHKNVEMLKGVINAEDMSYSLKRVISVYRFIPSISYTLTF